MNILKGPIYVNRGEPPSRPCYKGPVSPTTLIATAESSWRQKKEKQLLMGWGEVSVGLTNEECRCEMISPQIRLCIPVVLTLQMSWHSLAFSLEKGSSSIPVDGGLFPLGSDCHLHGRKPSSWSVFIFTLDPFPVMGVSV